MLRKFTLVLPLRYITAMTTVTLPVFVFSIAFSLPLMVSAAALVTLIGWGSVDIKLRAKGLSNLRCLSMFNPVSLYPIFLFTVGIATRIVAGTLLAVLLDSFLKPLFHK